LGEGPLFGEGTLFGGGTLFEGALQLVVLYLGVGYLTWEGVLCLRGYFSWGVLNLEGGLHTPRAGGLVEGAAGSGGDSGRRAVEPTGGVQSHPVVGGGPLRGGWGTRGDITNAMCQLDPSGHQSEFLTFSQYLNS